MTAKNINVVELMRVLAILKKKGIEAIDLDILPDDEIPEANKLVVHPITPQKTASYEQGLENPPEKVAEIQNPKINRDNNDIFNSQKFFGL